MYVKTRKEVVKTMGKYLVEVKVDWDNLFTVNAENKDAAAAKAKEAMDVLMTYIDYDTEDENVEWVGGWDNIGVVDTIECNDEEYANNVLKEEQEAANEIKGLKEWAEKVGAVPIPPFIAILGKEAIEKYVEVMK